MFDEGNNEVTINLPASVALQAAERAELHRQAEHNATLAAAMPKEVMPVRDFSIDMWNGRPGLQYWDYDETEPNAAK